MLSVRAILVTIVLIAAGGLACAEPKDKKLIFTPDVTPGEDTNKAIDFEIYNPCEGSAPPDCPDGCEPKGDRCVKSSTAGSSGQHPRGTAPRD